MSDPVDIERILENDDLIAAALAQATWDVLRQHKAAGNPVAVWQDEKVVWIPPEQIEIADDAAAEE